MHANLLVPGPGPKLEFMIADERAHWPGGQLHVARTIGCGYINPRAMRIAWKDKNKWNCLCVHIRWQKQRMESSASTLDHTSMGGTITAIIIQL